MKNLNSRLLAILCFSLVLFPLFSQSTNVFNFQLSPTEVNALASAQDYSIDVPLENGIAISLPDPNGNFVLYRFFKNKVISPKTAQTYSDIYTLTGYSPSNPDHFVNIVLHNGVISGIVLNKENAVILIRKGVNGYSSSFAEMKHFECLTEQGGNFRPSSNGGSRTASNGATLRNYTMGVVITDEYETANGGGATAIATAVTTISELSALYKKELAVEFTADVRPETSAFNIAPPGGSSAVYGGTVVAAYFSVGEYDLGHVFHTTTAGSGWSGQAGLGVVCDGAGTPPNKARGWSQGEDNNSYGFNSTVFHEVAHMFNASHTFNSNDAAICNASLNAATSYEPGSGTTIMAYPGVCGTHNITDTNGGTIFSSSPYFHISSLEQMVTYLGGTGNTCATSSSSGNTPPVAESNPCSAGSPLTIPLNTPFELVGSHTDANGDAVTYCWEQFDAGPPHGAPNVACGSTTGPIFRSYPPTTSPVRTFPSLEYVVNDANVPAPNTVGECLPSVARTLNFKLTVRDNHSTGGGIHCESLQLTVSGTAGPLAVTAPNTNVTWAAGSNTVTWNVNNTNSICSTVNIL